MPSELWCSSTFTLQLSVCIYVCKYGQICAYIYLFAVQCVEPMLWSKTGPYLFAHISSYISQKKKVRGFCGTETKPQLQYMCPIGGAGGEISPKSYWNYLLEGYFGVIFITCFFFSNGTQEMNEVHKCMEFSVRKEILGVRPLRLCLMKLSVRFWPTFSSRGASC